MANFHPEFIACGSGEVLSCNSVEPPHHRAVLLVSQCVRLEASISKLLYALEVRTVRISDTLEVWQALSTLKPTGIIVDLDIEVDVACNILTKMRKTAHAMRFIAATASTPEQEIRARESGADIFFESSVGSFSHIYCFFITTLSPERFGRAKINQGIQPPELQYFSQR